MVAFPLVSVLMSVYNGEAFLREAIESILRQTFVDFEFLIINDGSTDRTSSILADYQRQDVRIHVYDQQNRGLVATLNRGLELARGQYIARMDSDDIALPDRLRKQVSFLDTHEQVGVLGTACWLIDENGWDLYPNRWPVTDFQIRWVSLLSSPFAHPTVMLRRRVLLDNALRYDESCYAVEDYDLWIRLLQHAEGFNLNEPLLRYRLHPCSVTNRSREVQLQNHDVIALCQIRNQLPDFSIDLLQVRKLRAVFVGGSEFIPGVDTERVLIVEMYLNMLAAYVNRHASHLELDALLHQETLRISGTILRLPLRRGWWPIFRRLLSMNPWLPMALIAYLPGAIRRRMMNYWHQMQTRRVSGKL